MSVKNTFQGTTDNGCITGLKFTIGKLQGKYTALGSITPSYLNGTSITYGRASNITEVKTHDLALIDNEKILSITVYMAIGQNHVCGLLIRTTEKRKFGPYGVISKRAPEIKSPFSCGYYLASLSGSFGDVIHSLSGEYTSAFKSPDCSPTVSPTSTISSRTSAGSGYHSEDSLSLNRSMSSSDLENRLKKSFHKPATASSRSSSIKVLHKPPPPPRMDLREMKLGQPSILTTRNSFRGSLMTNRPILGTSRKPMATTNV
ncbi:Oidioi.mRNA.OKI2018_I69.PAR.g12009.t1.cds [Oikopleura dioica]|uniref:Oidioi.mRNA.OKI2018_I69.PAR.g12009.t1.cds n=1 Tax=Oikopleura dioica TaxID=34765 RepID=A0ABN7S346_OIKDI|nr:Oidioi.mRNA.OKI2018_I69.PAR.g12009.t1.cds [Oikopleura dioica]